MNDCGSDRTVPNEQLPVNNEETARETECSFFSCRASERLQLLICK
jgi:hypothetical protein